MRRNGRWRKGRGPQRHRGTENEKGVVESDNCRDSPRCIVGILVVLSVPRLLCVSVSLWPISHSCASLLAVPGLARRVTCTDGGGGLRCALHGRMVLGPARTQPGGGRMSNGEEWAEALSYRRRYRGVIGVASKVPIKDRSVLSLVYTPGVAEACLEIARDPDASFDLTSRGNTVAIVTDGSALFGRERRAAGGGAAGAGGQVGPLQDLRRDRRLPDLPRHARRPAIVQTLCSADARPSARSASTTSARRDSFTIADHLEKAGQRSRSSPTSTTGRRSSSSARSQRAEGDVGKRIEDVNVVVDGAGVAGIGVARLLAARAAKDVSSATERARSTPARPSG